MKGEGPTFPFAGDRWYAVGRSTRSTKEWLKMSQNQAHGDGGACYGDSGGPTFVGAGEDESDVVVAGDEHRRHPVLLDERLGADGQPVGALVPLEVRALTGRGGGACRVPPARSGSHGGARLPTMPV